MFFADTLPQILETLAEDNLIKCFVWLILIINVISVVYLVSFNKFDDKKLYRDLGIIWLVILVLANSFILFSHLCFYTIGASLLSLVLMILIVDRVFNADLSMKGYYKLVNTDDNKISFYLCDAFNNELAKSAYKYDNFAKVLEVIDSLEHFAVVSKLEDDTCDVVEEVENPKWTLKAKEGLFELDYVNEEKKKPLEIQGRKNRKAVDRLFKAIIHNIDTNKIIKSATSEDGKEFLEPLAMRVVKNKKVTIKQQANENVQLAFNLGEEAKEVKETEVKEVVKTETEYVKPVVTARAFYESLEELDREHQQYFAKIKEYWLAKAKTKERETKFYNVYNIKGTQIFKVRCKRALLEVVFFDDQFKIKELALDNGTAVRDSLQLIRVKNKNDLQTVFNVCDSRYQSYFDAKKKSK